MWNAERFDVLDEDHPEPSIPSAGGAVREKIAKQTRVVLVLARLLHDINHLAEAEPLYRRALAIAAASYGPDRPDVARELNILAELLHAINHRVDARPLHRRALAIAEARFGPDHPGAL